MEVRALGREEILRYPEGEYLKTVVTAIERDGDGFVVTHKSGQARARVVLLAAGLTETLPALPSIRTFYGTSMHSCMACDAYEYADQPIALIGETDDLAERALVLSQWSRDLVVFTNGVGTVSDDDETRLAERGVRIERRTVADVAGDRSGLTGVTLSDGETIPRVAAFVRPRYSPALGFAEPLGLAVDRDGLLLVDADGRTSLTGVYAAGDSTPPGPQQLIVAAGAGGRAADAINRDLLSR
jgi:thioredoxin reductase